MSGYGKGVSPLTSQTSQEKRDYLDARAKRLGWSRSEVVSTLIDFWFAMGAPALSDLDALAHPVEIPEGAREKMRTYWAESLPFDIAEGDTAPTAKSEAARLLARQHKAAQEKDTKDAASRGPRKRPHTAHGR